MLKTLEEPPPFAHLLLLTDRPGDVLATILSRCQLVRFEAPTVAALAERLGRQGVAPGAADACARLGLGDGERALQLALGDGPALRHGAEAFARAALHGRTGERPWVALLARAADRGAAAATKVEERLAADLPFLPRKEQGRAKREAGEAAKRSGRRARTDALDQALLLAGLWFRDVAVVADGARELAHASDRLAALEEDAAALQGPHRARAAVAYVDETRAALRMVNATEELALEALAYRLERTLRS
jgi:DNA polymerase-3 subunit delta'